MYEPLTFFGLRQATPQSHQHDPNCSSKSGQAKGLVKRRRIEAVVVSLACRRVVGACCSHDPLLLCEYAKADQLEPFVVNAAEEELDEAARVWYHPSSKVIADFYIPAHLKQ